MFLCLKILRGLLCVRFFSVNGIWRRKNLTFLVLWDKNWIVTFKLQNKYFHYFPTTGNQKYKCPGIFLWYTLAYFGISLKKKLYQNQPILPLMIIVSPILSNTNFILKFNFNVPIALCCQFSLVMVLYWDSVVTFFF